MNKIQKLGTGIAFLAGMAGSAFAGNSVEAIIAEGKDNNYLRVNSGYELPLEVKGHSFVEFYSDGQSYFGKTTLTKGLADVEGATLGLRTETKVGSSLDDKTGVGVQVSGKLGPVAGSIKFLPYWNNGSQRTDDSTIGYGIGTSLNTPIGKLSVGGFGEWNGDEWGYGELKVAKEIGDIAVSYNPALKNDGDASPDVQHRMNFSWRF